MCVLIPQALDLGQWPDRSGVGQLVSDLEVTFLEDGAQGIWEWVMIQVGKSHEDICVPCGYLLEKELNRGELLALFPVILQLPSPRGHKAHSWP